MYAIVLVQLELLRRLKYFLIKIESIRYKFSFHQFSYK